MSKKRRRAGPTARRERQARWCTLRLASLADVVSGLERSASPEVVEQRLREHLPVLRVFDDTLGEDWARNASAALPRDRAHCPQQRPCGHFLCQYHMALERTRHGSLRLVKPGIPLDEQDTCLYDFIEKEPDGISFAAVGRHFALKRTRMCQVWQDIAAKVKLTGILPEPSPKVPLPPRGPRVEKDLQMANPEDYVVPKKVIFEDEANTVDGNLDLGPRYLVHPIAQKYPLLSGGELEAFIADIKTHGQRESIKLFEGKILDGQNRYFACKRAGITPRVEQWVPGPGENPVDYVRSVNLQRRHLNESQRASLAAKMVELYEAYAPEKCAEMAPRNCGDASSSPTRAGAVQAAKTEFRVSDESMARAQKVMEHAVPELQAMVDGGELAVSAAAEVATALAPSKQKRFLKAKEPAKAVKRAAAKIRHKREAKRAFTVTTVTYDPSRIAEARAWVTKTADAEMAKLLGDALDALERLPQIASDAKVLAGFWKNGARAPVPVVERALAYA